jgi:hypothetical protein
MARTPKRLPFRDDLELAETATAGVQINLVVGDALVAAALQPVARAAWGLVEDSSGPGELIREARAALRRLELVCGATCERRFLADVIAYARGREHPAGAPRRRRTRRRASLRQGRDARMTGT